MSGELIAMRDVCLGYDGHAVLENVNLIIERGAFLALLGPNGAGKTTLLRGLLGLIPVMSGRIEYGFDRTNNPPGYVPQRDTLDPIFPLAALEVVLMGTYAKLRPGWPTGPRRRARAQSCLEQVGLADLASRPFWMLSGGQKQRVLIARALAVQPEILILDEPTAGVDHEAEAAIMSLISRLNHERGLTVAIVSHHLGRIRALVRSAVWVEDGAVVQVPIDELGEVGLRRREAMRETKVPA